MCECPRLVIRCHSYWGGFGGGETPLPIPNREVKPSCADGTARDTGWESRSPPLFVVEASVEHRGLFFLARGLSVPVQGLRPTRTARSKYARLSQPRSGRKPMRITGLEAETRPRSTGTVAALPQGIP